jgi:hypothetical protein
LKVVPKVHHLKDWSVANVNPKQIFGKWEFSVPNKNQEEFCRGEFDRWLKHHTGAIPEWKPGDEPPDFWLTLNDVKYAVEVTRIVCQDDRKDWASLRKLAKEVSEMARNAGELSGTYLVTFEGRVAQMSKVRRSIKDRLLHYIRQTTSVETQSGQAIEVDGAVLCTISKLHNRGAALCPAGGVHNKAILVSDAQTKLRQLLQDSFTAKCKIPGKTDCPTVLILYDLVGLFDKDKFIECVEQIPETKLFHTIYVVEDIGAGYVAHEGQPFS